MEIIANHIEQGTKVVKSLLEYLNIQPESYRFLFPAGKDSETIRQLVTDGVFPVISSLAPAFTYAIALSVIRFVMSHAVLKVCYNFMTTHLSGLSTKYSFVYWIHTRQFLYVAICESFDEDRDNPPTTE